MRRPFLYTSLMKSVGRIALAIPALIWLSALIVPSVWLLIVAATMRGRLIAVTGIFAAVWPWLMIAAMRRGAEFYRIRNGGAIALITGMLLIVFTAPSGSPRRESPVTNQYVGAGRFNRFDVSQLVPEIEQLQVGFVIAPYVDRLMDRAESQHLRQLTRDIHREMDADPNFRALGSALGYGYRDLLGGDPDSEHYYLYVPRNRSGDPMPALVFLHGSAGNFKAYTWLLSQIAEERGMVIIAPTFGFGNWRQEGGTHAIFRALEDASAITEIDQSRVYLAGLSNGGLGVSLAGYSQPKRFRGLIFLSPVFATEYTDAAAFQEAWRGRPVLILTGDVDDRIPVSYVQARIAAFRASGVDVQARIYPNEDHFLIFSQWDAIKDEIEGWLDQH